MLQPWRRRLWLAVIVVGRGGVAVREAFEALFQVSPGSRLRVAARRIAMVNRRAGWLARRYTPIGPCGLLRQGTRFRDLLSRAMAVHPIMSIRGMLRHDQHGVGRLRLAGPFPPVLLFLLA